MPTFSSNFSNQREGWIEEWSHVLDGITAAADGEWFSGAGVYSMHMECTITSATITFHGSNADTIPANSSDGVDIATAITATAIVKIDQASIPRWIKIHGSTVSTSADCLLKLRRYVGY